MCRPIQSETRRLSITSSSLEDNLTETSRYISDNNCLEHAECVVQYSSALHNTSTKPTIQELPQEKKVVGVVEPRRHYQVICIPEDHPLKISWDVVTIVLSIMFGIYINHVSILNSCFAHYFYDYCSVKGSAFSSREMSVFVEAWYAIDIVLNLFTKPRGNCSNRSHISNNRRRSNIIFLIWLFLDVVGVFVPWESMLVQPAFEIERRKGICEKLYNFLKFATTKTNRKHIAAGIQGFLYLFRSISWNVLRNVLLCLPRYIIFLKNMKIVMLIRAMSYAYRTKRLYSLLVRPFRIFW